MLKQVSIKNFAIIEETSISFSDKMTSLTGETGAGKSILIGALSLLAGARAKTDLIRTGSNKAIIEGVFDVSDNKDILDILQNEALIENSDEDLIIYREINSNGRSIIRLNGVVVSAKLLAQIGVHLLDIQGQNDTQQLLNKDLHLKFLDAQDDEKISDLLADYRKTLAKYQKVTKNIKVKKDAQQSFFAQKDLFEFQSQELELAKLEDPDEDIELQKKLDSLLDFEKVKTLFAESNDILNNDDYGLISQLQTVLTNLSQLAEYDTKYNASFNQLNDAYAVIDDIQRNLSDDLYNLEFDENELTQIQERLQLLNNLQRKYALGLADLIDYRDEVLEKVKGFENFESDIDELEKEQAVIKVDLLKKAKALSQARKTNAEKLEANINAQLADLLMPGAEFKVMFNNKALGLNGLDDVEFYVKTNLGEDLAPLVQIASGGETSRLMLALKTVFVTKNQIGTIVFDEADTGVSGRVATAIAKKMESIAQNCQVLVITHLPQVAAMADHQLEIKKEYSNNRTSTSVFALSEQERVNAIAMMLSADQITDSALENAKSLLEK